MDQNVRDKITKIASQYVKPEIIDAAVKTYRDSQDPDHILLKKARTLIKRGIRESDEQSVSLALQYIKTVERRIQNNSSKKNIVSEILTSDKLKNGMQHLLNVIS